MIYSYELCGRPKIIWFVRPRCQVVCSNMKRLTQIIDSQSIVKTVICDGWFTLTTTAQTIANPGSWNVVQLSAVDDMLRRVNITLNNVQGERISVNNLTVTGCYDPTGTYSQIVPFLFPCSSTGGIIRDSSYFIKVDFRSLFISAMFSLTVIFHAYISSLYDTFLPRRLFSL